MNKLNAAESLRGIACIAVVFSHTLGVFFPQFHSFYKSDLPEFRFIELIYDSPLSFFYSGTGAVFVFFVLSGYVLTLSFMKSTDPDRKFKECLVKRYPRLAIPALVSCILMWFVFNVDVNLIYVSEWFRGIKPDDLNFIAAINSGLFGAFIFGDKTYNPVLWTMQIELFGSFLIYFLCYINSKKIVFYSVLFFCLIISFIVSPLVFLGILAFLIGYFFYHFNFHLNSFFGWLLLLAGLYFCGAHLNSESYKFLNKLLFNKTYFILNFLGGVLIVFSILKCESIQNLLDRKFLVKLGALSFSIYLIHLSVLYIIGVPIFNLVYEVSSDFLFASSISIIVSLVFIYFFSVIYSRYIDNYSIKVSNFFSRKLIK